MPEGDTIHRTAARLRPVLGGRTVDRFEAPRLVGDRPIIGESIMEVEAKGKHLLIGFSGGLTLQTHMRMTGSWHIYRVGESWQKPPWMARVTIGVDGWVAVCFSAPTVRTFRRGGFDDPTAHLGPDLVEPEPDLDVCLERMAQLPEAGTTIAEVLLDQRIANGVGNVFKSEVLWACGVSPFTPIERVDTADRRRLLAVAAKQLRANLGSGPRTTVAGGLAVYGRRGSPCRRCGTPVKMKRHGTLARSTYWCPTCQPSLDLDENRRTGG